MFVQMLHNNKNITALLILQKLICGCKNIRNLTESLKKKGIEKSNKLHTHVNFALDSLGIPLFR